MKMRKKMSLFLTAVALMAAPGAFAFENLLLPATNTLDAVKQELWFNGIESQPSSEKIQSKSSEMPEEVTLGLEKWESSL